MLEILVIWFLAKRFGDAAANKGRSPTVFTLIFLVWFLFCYFGAMAITASSKGISNVELFSTDFLTLWAAAWVGGLIGTLIAAIILAVVPAVHNESYYDKMQTALDDLRDRKGRKRWRPPVRTADEPEPTPEPEPTTEPEPASRSRTKRDDDAPDDEPETAVASEPKQRRSASRDDDDDREERRPRRRRSRRYRDDEDEEEAPTRSSGGLVAVIILCILGVVGVGAGLTYYLLSDSSTDDHDSEAQVDDGGGRPQQPQPPPPPPTNLDQALDAVRSAQFARRIQGANWIADAAPDPDRKREVATVLERMLDDGDGAIAELAARSLIKWGSVDNVRALIRKANGPTLPGRSVLDALGEFKEPRAPVAAAVAHWLPNPTYRKAAEEALVKIGPAPEAEAEVKKYALHPNADTREAAMRLLRGYGHPDPDLFDTALAQLKSEKPADLSTDITERAAAADWFAKAKPDDAKRAVVTQALEPLLNDGNFRVSNAAAKALAIWATEEHVSILIDYLNSHFDNYVYEDSFKAIIGTLSRFPNDRGIEAIVRCLGKEKLRLPAQTALKTIGDKAGPIVARHAFDPLVGEKARDVLRELGDKPEHLIQGAVVALNDKYQRVREDALDYLARTEPEASCRDLVAKAINPIMENPKGFQDRDQALKIAEKWGTKENVPTLIKMLELPLPGDKGRRRLAMLALVAIKDERAVWPLGRRLANRDDLADALAALQLMGPMVEKVATAKIEDTDNQTRADAWALLGLCGSKVNYDTLKAIADKESNTVVKKTANAALAQIKKR
jgi:HEAT repeat protein